ncbi:tRNA pseudouridine(55) synthase TruB [Thermaurantiacus sp.]
MSRLHGWLVIDKPVGATSANIIGKLKHALRAGGHGKTKLGHGGTLDPLATGVLPVAIGEATKLAGHLLHSSKSYRFTIRFGTATATDDAEGPVVATRPLRPQASAIAAILPQFTGSIRQRPPAFSAIRVEGRRAYARARAGEAVVLPERDIVIERLALVAADGESATLEVRCSKGTYVRSLARDIAAALGTVGHVSMLRRTAAGPFREEQALPLDKALRLVQEAHVEQALLPLAAGLDGIPVLAVTPADAAHLQAGRRIAGPEAKPGLHLATLGSVPVALVEVSQGDIRVVRGLNLEERHDVDHRRAQASAHRRQRPGQQ